MINIHVFLKIEKQKCTYYLINKQEKVRIKYGQIIIIQMKFM